MGQCVVYATTLLCISSYVLTISGVYRVKRNNQSVVKCAFSQSKHTHAGNLFCCMIYVGLVELYRL